MEVKGGKMTIQKLLFETAAIISMMIGPGIAGNYTPATAPKTPQETLMLAAAMAFAAGDNCPFVQVNTTAFAEAMLDGHVDILDKDKQLFLDHVEWARSAVKLAILRRTPPAADFCANAWKTMGPGSPMPFLERVQ
jgi:hypothetical protein